jgi:hypothetical protein
MVQHNIIVQGERRDGETESERAREREESEKRARGEREERDIEKTWQGTHSTRPSNSCSLFMLSMYVLLFHRSVPSWCDTMCQYLTCHFSFFNDVLANFVLFRFFKGFKLV